MRPTALAVAIVAAMLAHTALADTPSVHVSLNPQGLGQGLMFPFFTTNNGHSTLLSVQNTSAQGKALKVHVRDGREGGIALHFNLYIPATATWTAAIVRDSDAAPARLVAGTPGVGCMLPAMPSSGYELQPSSSGAIHDGSVDIVELGTIDDELAAFASNATAESCIEFAHRADPDHGVWSTAPNDGIGVPTGLLKGSATLIDVEDGTSFSYDAPAFNGLAFKARHTTYYKDGNDVLLDDFPRLSSIQVPSADARMEFDVLGPLGKPVRLAYRVYGGLEYPVMGFAVIGGLLATASATGSFFLNPDFRGRTEWVVSFPTYVDTLVSVLPMSIPGTINHPPFAANGTGEELQLRAWERDGDSLPAPASVVLYGGVNILSVVKGDGPIDRKFARDDSPVIRIDADAGTMRLDFKAFDADEIHASWPDLNCRMLAGLPAWVMPIQWYDNDNAQPGRIATFPVEEAASGPVEIVECEVPAD